VANYPSFAQLVASEEGFLDDLLVDRAVNGNAKVRALYTTPKRRFTVKHRLSTTDRNTLQAFYSTNRALTFVFTWAGNSTAYTCIFEGPPTYDYADGMNVDVTVRIAEQ
jgi:hypothetical protein